MNTSTSTPHILAQRKQTNKQHVSKIVSHAADTDQSFDEELGSNCPIFDKFYEKCGSTVIIPICNFTVSEFQKI